MAAAAFTLRPYVLFINKTDRTGADPQRVLGEIRQLLSGDAVMLPGLAAGAVGEELRAFLAERDESLFEAYLDGSLDEPAWTDALVKLVRQGKIFPCMAGSALLDEGIGSFLNNLDTLAVTEYDHRLPFAGRVYKVRYDEKGTRITYIKALQGVLKAREELTYGLEQKRISERITGIRRINGAKTVSADWGPQVNYLRLPA